MIIHEQEAAGHMQGGSSRVVNPVESSGTAGACRDLAARRSRGELGEAIAALVLAESPRALERMRWNFSGAIQGIDPRYRKELEERITAHLHGTYQRLRLMHQQGDFSRMAGAVPENAKVYWEMVAVQCAGGGDDEARHFRFLKYLLAGFCMLVLFEPGHPVETPFPGGDAVEFTGNVYYCPVREKANDVDAALCPFCPARQTPEVGYLKPPTGRSGHRKQEYIEHVYEHHHFNG